MKSTNSKILAFVLIYTFLGIIEVSNATMVPLSSCKMKSCTCADAPMIEEFNLAQSENLNAWDEVLGEFASLNPPASIADARARYSSKVTAHNAILQVCPSWGGKDVQLGGITQNGDPEVDSCFCNSFCDKIVLSVIEHEKRHKLNIYALAAAEMPNLIIASMIPGSFGRNRVNSLQAQSITLSEIDAHMVQVNYLDRALHYVIDNTPRSCTWTSITPAKKSKFMEDQTAASKSSFLERVSIIANRVVNGAK